MTIFDAPPISPAAPAEPDLTTPPADPVGIRELIGRNLRRLRLDGVVSTEDIIRAARNHGLEWTASWLGAVERAQKPVSAEQLIALPVVLSDALGHRVALADLLLGDEPVLLAATEAAVRVPVSAGYLREVLTTAPYRRAFTAPDAANPVPPNEHTLARAAGKMRDIGRAGLGDVDIRALNRAEAGATDVEDKLARKLGVPTIVLIAAAASLWGRSLSEERAARLAPPDAEAPEADLPKPAAVMRRLTGQLAARLEAAEEAARQADLAAAAEAEAGSSYGGSSGSDSGNESSAPAG
jgi:hypothetical protein